MKKIILITIGVFVLGLSTLFVTKSYPVIIVNGHFVSANFFDKNFNAANSYYKKLFSKYENQSISVDSEEFRKESKKLVIEKIIEDKLVHYELSELMKKKELALMIENKVGDIIEKNDLESGARSVYGFSEKEFVDNILRPKAELEILKGRFFMENKDFSEWLLNSKNEANVVILLSGFFWNNLDGEINLK